MGACSYSIQPIVAPGRVFDLRPSGILSAAGEPLTTGMAAYTLNRLR